MAPAHRLIAGKAYEADRSRLWLGEGGIVAVIPARASRDVANPFNRAAYRRRNVIERMFGKLNYRWRLVGYKNRKRMGKSRRPLLEFLRR